MNNLTEQKERKTKTIVLRISENLLSCLKEKAKEFNSSTNNYINLILDRSVEKKEVSFKEVLGKLEKKEIKSGLYLTKSEAELLKQYAQTNEWSVSKELRYRESDINFIKEAKIKR